MGHRCRHDADASLRFRVIEPWQRVLIQLVSCLRVSLVRQLARSACPRSRLEGAGARWFSLGDESQQPRTGREQIDLRAKAITLDEVGPNGKPPRSSSSVSVSPSPCSTGDKRCSATMFEAAMLRQTAIADCTFFGTHRTTHFTAIALGRQRKLEARTKTARRDRPGQRHPSHGSLVRRLPGSAVLAQKTVVDHRGKIRFGS